MDGLRFRSLCANVDRLSVEQLRALRLKLRALDALSDEVGMLNKIRGRIQNARNQDFIIGNISIRPDFPLM